MRAKPLFGNDAQVLTNTKMFVGACIVLQAKAGVYYTILSGTDIFWTKRIATAATDGIYVYINPDFFSGLANESQRAFLLAHEVGHIVLGHMDRGTFYKRRGYFAYLGDVMVPWSHGLYNKSADYVINADLVAHGLEMIPSGLLDASITRNDIADRVYLDLYKKQEEQKQQQPQEKQAPTSDKSEEESDEDCQSQSGGDESNDESEGDESEGESGDDSEDGDSGPSGDAGDDSGDEEGEGTGSDDDASDEPVGDGEHFEPQYEGDEEEQEDAAREDRDEVKRKVDEAIDRHADDVAKGEQPAALSTPFSCAGNRHDGGNASGTDWRTELADLFTRTGNEGESCWSRIHRRRFVNYGVVTPSKRGMVTRIAITVDISYSVSRTALHAFLTEVASLIDLINPTSGTLVMFTNTEVVRAHEVFSGGELLDLDIPQGGGTEMSSALKYMAENGLEADFHLCFTDGEMSRSDIGRLADAGVVVVLDRPPYSYIANNLAAVRTVVVSR